MRVLVTGAYGLIGSAVLARLLRDGHDLVAAGRTLEQTRRRCPVATCIVADYTRLTSVEAWRPLLAGIDAVVNCVGVLQHGGRDDMDAVHVKGTCALFHACVAAGVRRVVHVSAIGAAADGASAFARSKAQADANLARLDLDWAILRPALVLAPAAYGGTAMLRGLAGLPWLAPSVASRVQVVSIDDVADTVALCLAETPPPMRCTWELAHPQVHDLGDIVAGLRRWHGFPPRRRWTLPATVRRLVAQAADVAGRLGWRSPARSTAMAQLEAGVVGDPTTWMQATGVRPKSLAAILADRPAGVQDRWFARLYWLKPVAILGLAAFWIATGLIALGPGRTAALEHLVQAGFGPGIARLTLDLGSLFDIAMGVALCVQRYTRRVLQIMLATTLGYLLVGTLAAPQLWADPLGPYLKILPMLVATALTLAIVDER